MDEKIYDLLEKVYIELQQTKRELGNHIVRLEHQFSGKIGVMNDEIAAIKSDIEFIKNKVDIVEQKIEKHEVEISVIQGGKEKIV